MKSNKKLLVSVIFGLLCANGVSLAAPPPVLPNNDVKVDVSVAATKVDAPSADTSISAEKVQTDDDEETPKPAADALVKIRLLDNDKQENQDGRCDPCCQNVYNLNYIPSPEVDQAVLNFINESTDFMNKMFTDFSDILRLRKCSALPSATSQVPPDAAHVSEKAASNVTFPSVELRMSDELTKPVLYHTRSYDKLSKLAKEYLGDTSEVDVIKSMSENADVFSKMVKRDKLPDDEYLYIPQPAQDKDWLLYKVDEKDTFYSLARKFYGSWECARLLAEFNGRAYLPERIYDRVIKLPKTLNFSNYVVSSDDSTLSCLCDKLLGSPAYADVVAKLNGLDVNKPLRVGTPVFVPSFSENDLVKETTK